MQLSDFDYDLPEELIAQQPLERRDASRMLVVDRAAASWENSVFRRLPDYIRRGDLVVVNNTRVFPARLIGQRDPTGGHVEVLLSREVEPEVWEALVRPARRLKIGDRLRFNGDLKAEVLDWSTDATRQLRFDRPIESLLNTIGQTPLPPYIRRPSGTTETDRERYQTLFARERGAIAAPTAGLHFTSEVTDQLKARGAQVVEITLHVGYGTFEPVRVEDIEDHHVSSEFIHVSEDAATIINRTTADGGRVIAVGTTTTRALESAVNSDGIIEATSKTTDLTILPGYKFQIVSALITNFHLPRSSLLLLISAFAGRDLTLNAYRYAVEQRYRFYSYGDCMFVI